MATNTSTIYTLAKLQTVTNSKNSSTFIHTYEQSNICECVFVCMLVADFIYNNEKPIFSATENQTFYSASNNKY